MAGIAARIADNGAKFFCLGLAVVLLLTLAVILHSGNALRYDDELEYLGHAQRLFQGLGYVLPNGAETAYRPPGYAFLLTLGVSLFDTVTPLKCINAVMLLVSIGLMGHMAAREGSRCWFLAPWLVVIYPALMYTASTLYPQTACLLLMVSVVTLISASGRTYGAAALAGAIHGALMLTAPSYALISPILLGWMVCFDERHWRHGLWRAALFSVCACAVLTPWQLRNLHVFGEHVFISTNGGLNLLLGNSENAGPNTGIKVDLSRYAKQVEGLGEAALDESLKTSAIQWVRTHPQQAGVLYLGKVLNYFNCSNDLATANQHGNWQDWLIGLVYYPMLLLVLWRVACMRRLSIAPTECLLLLVYFGNAFIAAIFFTRVRFRLPYDALLMVLVTMALPKLWSLTARSERITPVPQ